MQLEMALANLQEKVSSDELMFWGKINGMTNDYYIAVAMQYQGQYEFPSKTFYWALSTDFVFKEMPALTDQHNEAIDGDASYFIGEPNKNLLAKGDGEEENAEEAPVEEELEEGEEGQ